MASFDSVDVDFFSIERCQGLGSLNFFDISIRYVSRDIEQSLIGQRSRVAGQRLISNPDRYQLYVEEDQDIRSTLLDFLAIQERVVNIISSRFLPLIALFGSIGVRMDLKFTIVNDVTFHFRHFGNDNFWSVLPEYEGAERMQFGIPDGFGVHRGATENMISRLLEERIVSDEWIGTQMMGSDCTICFESFLRTHLVVVLPCGHYFHGSCISRWIRIQANCPVCRRVPFGG